MSIEAMKRAIEAWDACGRYPDATSDIERLDVAINALRTAIQQAESEPVGAREALERIASWSEHPAMLGVDYGSNGVRDYYRKIASDALTHPAPGVPTVPAAALDRLMALLETQAAQIIELEDSRDAEPGVPDDVVRDARRWRTFLATRPSNTHEGIIAAIDAASPAQKGAADATN